MAGGREHRVFFGHASEDKPQVEDAYASLVAAHPRVKPWVDKYELVGGDDLFDSIASGMDDAERFFLFLSDATLSKRWPERELKRALALEFGGRDNYVVPVLLDGTPKVPAFLEHKKWVDLRGKTEDEAVAELYAAITGSPPKPEPPGDGLTWSVDTGSAKNVAKITFSVRTYAIPISFTIQTSAAIQGRDFYFEPKKGAVLVSTPGRNLVLRDGPNEFSITADDRVERERGLVVELTFAAGIDGRKAITGVGPTP